MFDKKKQSLFFKKEGEKNIFQKEKEKKRHIVRSENGAVKLDTTANAFVDDFGAIASYKEPRELSQIFATMSHLWSIDKKLALKSACYIRMITRDTKYLKQLFKGSKGQGLRFEFLGRMMWVAINHPNIFKKNLALFVSIGSWQDIFDLMELDLSYVHNGRNHALNWDDLIEFIALNIQDPDQTNLIKKYLPQIKPAKRCTTLHSQCTNTIAKTIADKLCVGKKSDNPSEVKASKYSQYRHLKASGTAHQWQQAISRKEYHLINFNQIAGRALKLLVNSKFLKNHDLEEKYQEWLKTQKTAKTTNYVYELFAPVDKVLHREFAPLEPYQLETIDKQFQALIDKAHAENLNANMLICLDVSYSMTRKATGTPCSAECVGRSMVLYFNELINGPFKGTYLSFDDQVEIHTLKGSSPSQKYLRSFKECYGSTNFLGVAHKLVSMRHSYKEEEFPDTILCISDGEFNGCYSSNVDSTTFEEFKRILAKGGFSTEYVDKLKLILWDIDRGQGTKFEAVADAENFFHISGLDGSVLTFLFAEDKTIPAPKSTLELFIAAMEQEILQQIQV